MAYWNVMCSFDFRDTFQTWGRLEFAKIVEFDDIFWRRLSHNVLPKMQFSRYFGPMYHFRKLTIWTIEILHETLKKVLRNLCNSSTKWNIWKLHPFLLKLLNKSQILDKIADHYINYFESMIKSDNFPAN